MVSFSKVYPSKDNAKASHCAYTVQNFGLVLGLEVTLAQLHDVFYVPYQEKNVEQRDEPTT
jgi:hypothetical protein